MRLLVSGDGIRTVTVTEEELTAKSELLVHVELAADRCYLVVELADPAHADRFELRDAGGAAVELELRRGGSATSSGDPNLELQQRPGWKRGGSLDEDPATANVV